MSGINLPDINSSGLSLSARCQIRVATYPPSGWFLSLMKKPIPEGRHHEKENINYVIREISDSLSFLQKKEARSQTKELEYLIRRRAEELGLKIKEQ